VNPTDSSDPSLSSPPEDPFERIGPVPEAFKIARHDGLGQLSLRSQRRFAPGETLSAFSPRSLHQGPHRMTVQVSKHDHIELAPRFLELINHSCAPNVAFDTERFELIALAPIEPGDELCFFYPSTEWFMADPFECACGHHRCHGRISGASQMPASALSGHYLAAHIVSLLREQREETGPEVYAF